jgi:hypothetical protein
MYFVSGADISMWKEIGNTLLPAFYLGYLRISLQLLQTTENGKTNKYRSYVCDV